MSLLGNLVSQVARSAMNANAMDSGHPAQQKTSSDALGGILSQVLGGQSGNAFGLDDIIGGLGGEHQGGGRRSDAGGLADVLGSVLGGAQASGRAGGKSMLIAALMPMVLSWIQRNGGVGAALSKITDMGHDNQVRSWVSSHEDNDTLDPNEINQLFDEKEIEHVAAKTGANEAEVRQGLAELLPEVMNQLTPNGTLDNEAEANEEIDQIVSQISARLGALR